MNGKHTINNGKGTKTCSCGRKYKPWLVSKGEKVDRSLCRPCYRRYRTANHIKQASGHEALDPLNAIQSAKRRCERAIDSLAAPATRIRGIKAAVAALNANKKALCLIEDDLRCVRGVVRRCSNERWRRDEFNEMVREVADSLPTSACISEEWPWALANLHDETPDFSTAPSVIAANMLVAVRTDDALRKSFWLIMCQRRMTLSKTKQSPFEVDRVEVARLNRQEDGESDVELMKRLFGSN